MLSRIKLLLLLVLCLPGFNLAMSKGGDLPSDEYARRRTILMNELREVNACAIIHSAPELKRNSGVNHPYRQDSDFFYLTGWPAARGILVLTPKDEKQDQDEAILFVPEHDPKSEIWTGPTKTLTDAIGLPGIDLALNYEAFYDHLSKLIGNYDRLVISYGMDKEFEAAFQKEISHIYNRPMIIQEARGMLQAHRLIKSDQEILALEKAIEITGESLVDAFAKIPSLHFEYEVQAEIEYGFRKRGSARLGFPSIVGSGKNTTYLHYEGDRGELKSGDLLLMDVGAEWDYYSADISRTVPVSGKFTPEQAQIYGLVLDAQLAAIQCIKPGVAFRQPHNIAVEHLTKGLVELGLLQGDVTTLIAKKAYRKYFMHGTSHWLGLDVHDAGGRLDENGDPYLLKAGMVLTVEPGIYITESDAVDSKWWNIGVRIEDDVLVTPKGYRVLSASIPKTIQQIEGIMQP
mgnify:CR=1 FL=1